MSWMDYHERIGRRRMLLTVEARADVASAKTATGVLAFCPGEVVAVLDSSAVGRSTADALGVDSGVPILASVAHALPLRPTELVIGVATAGGYISGEIRRQVVDAIEVGLDVVNGLHVLLREDAEIVERAAQRGVRLFDLRDPPAAFPIGGNRAGALSCTRILTVGTDCNVGKMFTSLKLTDELRRRGRRAEFAATGQTGILIGGVGVAVDRVISDFISGAVEWLVGRFAEAEFCLVEGQGAITHPAYSGVSLGLLHGAAPDGLIVCHRAGRDMHRHTDCRVPPIKWVIRTHERITSVVHPSRVLGIAVDSRGLETDERARLLASIEAETGLPTIDPGIGGIERLADRIEALRDEHAARQPRISS